MPTAKRVAVAVFAALGLLTAGSAVASAATMIEYGVQAGDDGGDGGDGNATAIERGQ